MKKIETIYVCSKCDAQFPKWSGRCLSCGAWGTVESQKLKIKDQRLKDLEMPIGEVVEFFKIKGKGVTRIKTGIEELDRVLGGGIVPGSLVLLGGEPGIGKSTLVLQIAEKVTQIDLCKDYTLKGELRKGCKDYTLKGELRKGDQSSSCKDYTLKSELRKGDQASACEVRKGDQASACKGVLYISGEESAEQIKMRIDRLRIQSKNLQFLGETDIEIICATIDKKKPVLAIIDSIQTMYFSDLPSGAGSVNQVRACSVKLLEVAKKNNIPIFITGHVTKEGAVAGPKTLEHLVDTVLYLEGDQHHLFRLLRSVKNRFGSTNEVGVFKMRERGLKEVKNPSEAFLQERGQREAGSVITAVMEGSRAFLVEVQALVSRTYFGYPQRKASGFDYNRLGLLIAVLTQRCKLALGNQDVHLNLAGGIKITEPAIDIAVCLAIASAFKNKPLDSKLVAFGEVGLGGEIRSISQIDKRLTEVEKLGFDKVIMPDVKLSKIPNRLQVVKVKNLREAIENF